jgi:hypothetical protein
MGLPGPVITSIAMANGRRFADPREYALAAFRDFQSFGDRARDDVMKALQLNR